MPVFLMRNFDRAGYEAHSAELAAAQVEAAIREQHEGKAWPEDLPQPNDIVRAPAEFVKYEKVIGELSELQADYYVTVLNKGTPKEVTILTPKFHSYPSELDPTGLVPSFCEHGEKLHPLTGKEPRPGVTWVASCLLEVVATGTLPQVKCHCEDPEWPRCPRHRQ